MDKLFTTSKIPLNLYENLMVNTMYSKRLPIIVINITSVQNLLCGGGGS